MTFSTTMDVTVAWGDCAPSGAVFYPNYFRWFDAAVWNFFEGAGLPLLQLEAEYGTVGIPLIKTEANFLAPVRLRDRLTIETSIVEWQRKTLTLVHLIRKGEVTAIEGRDLRFWGVRHPSEPGRLKAEEIPAAIRGHFARLDSAPGETVKG